MVARIHPGVVMRGPSTRNRTLHAPMSISQKLRSPDFVDNRCSRWSFFLSAPIVYLA